MHYAEPRKALVPALMANVALYFIDINVIHKKVGCTVPVYHYVAGHPVQRIERAQQPPVLPVAKAPLPVFCHG